MHNCCFSVEMAKVAKKYAFAIFLNSIMKPLHQFNLKLVMQKILYLCKMISTVFSIFKYPDSVNCNHYSMSILGKFFTKNDVPFDLLVTEIKRKKIISRLFCVKTSPTHNNVATKLSENRNSEGGGGLKLLPNRIGLM